MGTRNAFLVGKGSILVRKSYGHVWIALLTTLTFASWVSSEQVVLMKTPDCRSCVWSWSTYHFTCNTCMYSGWDYPSIPGQTPKNRYSVCLLLLPGHVSSFLKEPNNWLRSDLIHVGEVQKVDVIVKYSINKCPDVALFCKEFFDVFVWESNASVASDKIPHPINNNSSYRRFANITRRSNNLTTSLIPLVVTSRYIVLGFRDQGGCRILYSVKVTYKVCPQETLSQSLVSVPRTLAPINESLPVKGSCTADSVHAQGRLNVLCESSGEWNTSLLEGRCICKEDMENTGGKCEDCKSGEYNNQRGHNCTALPSAPKNAIIMYVNQSAVALSWQSPEMTGDHSQVFYDVSCLKPCNRDADKKCVEETCRSDVRYIPDKKRLNKTQVMVINLFSFVNYTFKIYARNRVSEVAKRKYQIEGNFTAITVRTLGTIPGTPELSIQQAEDAFAELSWELKYKNGIIKKYHVTYYREGDTSNKETLTTNAEETKVRIEKLAPGKTFVFQVVAENNFGRGPAGEKTFTFSSDYSNTDNMIIYIVVSTVLGVVLFIVSTLFGLYVYRQRKSQNILPQSVDLSQAFEGRMEEFTIDVIEERNVSQAQYMDISDIPSFELARDEIEFVRLLGNGNFGEVFKANMGHATVAVKSLKETATAKDKQDMITELNVMKRLKPHPHVLKLIGCCSHSDPLLIVLEYLPYGDLLGYLRKSRGHSDSYHSGEKKPTSKLTANDLLSFAWMIADGMNYLAKMKIVHRDLAARNVLVGEDKVCKVSDFGLARDVNADIYVRTTQARLPVKWMPPESLFCGESSTMSDVWSYGIVLWEVFTIGDSPYPGVKARKVASLLERGYRMPRPIHISEELFSIFSECWSEKPEDRPTFQWICAAVKRLIEDRKTYVNLDVYNDGDYVNFDMVDELH